MECLVKYKKTLPSWRLQITPEKIQRGDSINYLGYKISLQRVRPQKVQIRRNQLRTLNNFQKLLGDTSIGLTTQELSNLFQTLQGDKDLIDQGNYQLRLIRN